MQVDAIKTPTFVVKAEELSALNYLSSGHPRPQLAEWINRGTDQTLKQTSVDMLLRTLFRDVLSPSVVRLHRLAGLRVIFRTDRERDQFAAAFAAARVQNNDRIRHHVTAIFDHHDYAELAVAELKRASIPGSSIAMMWLAGQFMDTKTKWPEGHSKFGVSGAVAGGGVAGAMLGVAVLAIPGVGQIAATGAIAASAISSVATVSGVIGAVGGAIAKMLTDHDVDGVSASYYQRQIRRGTIFVSVDIRIANGQREVAQQILTQNAGRTSTRN